MGHLGEKVMLLLSCHTKINICKVLTMKTLNERNWYGLNLFLLIDEGIAGYRKDPLEVSLSLSYTLLPKFTCNLPQTVRWNQ